MLEKINIECGKLSQFLNNNNDLIFSLCPNNGKIINTSNNEFSIISDIQLGDGLFSFWDIVISPNDEYITIITIDGAILIFNLVKNEKAYIFNDKYRFFYK